MQDWKYGTVTRTDSPAKFRSKSTPKEDGNDSEWRFASWKFVEKVEV